MEIADIIIKRIEGENDSKKQANLLVCFSSIQTGKALGKLAHKIMRNKPGKASITILNLIEKQQAEQIGDETIYKTELLSNINISGEADKLTIRTFVKQADNFANEILNTAEGQNSNMIIFGIGHNLFSSSLWEKYLMLKSDSNIIGDEKYQNNLGKKAALTLRNISTLLNKQELTTGIFISNKYQENVMNIFVPILKDSDTYSFPFFYQLAKNQDVIVTVWDAIGLISSNSKLKKLFNYISKKVDGKIMLWNNNNKIDNEFIEQLDLIIIGFEGWEKLITTPLSWIKILPSVLIIKDKRS